MTPPGRTKEYDGREWILSLPEEERAVGQATARLNRLRKNCSCGDGALPRSIRRRKISNRLPSGRARLEAVFFQSKSKLTNYGGTRQYWSGRRRSSSPAARCATRVAIATPFDFHRRNLR